MNSIAKLPTEQSRANNALNILIVEDEPSVADYLKEILTGRPSPAFSCSLAETLSEAVACLNQEQFDLVLLDLGLPDSQGIDTALVIRKHFPRIPIVVLTGLTDEETGVEALRRDVQDYLIKGQISGALLVRSIRYAVERKRAAEAVRESEEWMRLAAQAAGFGTYHLDVKTGEMFWSQELKTLLGVPPGSDSKVPLLKGLKFVHPADREHVKRVLAASMHPGSGKFREEHRIVRANGEVIWVLMRGQTFFEGEGEQRRPVRTVAVLTDITERKRAEEALRTSQERLRMVVEAARVLIYEVDLGNNRIVIVRGLKEVFGYEPAEISLTRGWWEKMIHPDDRERIRAHVGETIRSGADYAVEYRMLHKRGSYITVQDTGKAVQDETGRVMGFVGGVADVTERKRTEDALRHSEERYRALVHAASSAVWRVSADGNTLLELTGAVAREYREPEPQSGEWIEYIHPDDRKRTLETWRRAVETKSLYEMENRNLHPDGTYHYVLSRGVPVLDAGGEVREWIGSTVDITERKHAEQALRESEERFRTLADNIAQLAWMANESGWIFWYNKRWFDYTGTTLEEMQGWGWQKAHHPDHVQRVVEKIRRSFETGAVWEDTFPLRGRDGGYRWFLSRAIPIRNEEGKVVHWFGTNTDITERKQMEENIKHMAQHDALTGLPNRRLFNEIIAVELAQARRYGKKVALFFLDLDRFKEINDTLGHDAGDELLKQTAVRLKALIRLSDTVARIGGDEFNIIIPDISYPEYASEVAQKMLNEVRRPFTVYGHELRVSISIGISIFPHDSDELDTLLRYADIAMYHAKEHGRDMYQFYNPDINTRSLERMRFENSLRRAIERGEFRLYYQPLIDVKSRAIVSAEALLRWQHPEQGLLEPRQFFGAAEETGFMPEIDEWVLMHAGRQLKEWRDEGLPPVCVTVNLSSGHFQSPDLIKRISRVLDETGLPPELLDIEITEMTAMSNIENTIVRLDNLSKIGVHVSIDDFGSGCSSLSLLKRLPVQKVKIDKTFIRDIAVNSADRAIIGAILLMAHSMKLKVVAEGVEETDQLRFLHVLHCDEAQGFFFSRPLPAEKFRELVSPR